MASTSKQPERKVLVKVDSHGYAASVGTFTNPIDLVNGGSPTTQIPKNRSRGSYGKKRQAHRSAETKVIAVASSISTKQILRLQGLYPEYRFEPTSRIINGHALSRARRRIEHTQLLNAVSSRSELVLDIGGKLDPYVLIDTTNVHVCKPLLDARDSSRWTEDLESLRRRISLVTDENRAHTMSELVDAKNHHYCSNSAEDCDFPARSAIALHSLYDINVAQLGAILDRHDTRILEAVVIFSPQILVEQNGYIEGHDVNFNTIVEDGRVYIKFTFRNDTANSYRHDKAEFIKMCTATSIHGPDHSYVVERTILDGSMYLHVTRASFEVSRNTRLEFSMWGDYGSKDVYVSALCARDAGESSVRNMIRSRRVRVPRDFVDKVLAQAGSCAEEKFSAEEVWSYARGVNTVFSVNGVDVTVVRGLGAEDFNDVCLTLYATALKMRLERKIMVAHVNDVQRTLSALRGASVFTLVKALAAAQVKWLVPTQLFQGGTIFDAFCEGLSRSVHSAVVEHNKLDVTFDPAASIVEFSEVTKGFELLNEKPADMMASMSLDVDVALVCNQSAVIREKMDVLAAIVRAERGSDMGIAAEASLLLLKKALLVVNPEYDGGVWSEREQELRQLDEALGEPQLDIGAEVSTVQDAADALQDAHDVAFSDIFSDEHARPPVPARNTCPFDAVSAVTGMSVQELWNGHVRVVGVAQARAESEAAEMWDSDILEEMSMTLDMEIRAHVCATGVTECFGFSTSARAITVHYHSQHYSEACMVEKSKEEETEMEDLESEMRFISGPSRPRRGRRNSSLLVWILTVAGLAVFAASMYSAFSLGVVVKRGAQVEHQIYKGSAAQVLEGRNVVDDVIAAVNSKGEAGTLEMEDIWTIAADSAIADAEAEVKRLREKILAYERVAMNAVVSVGIPELVAGVNGAVKSATHAVSDTVSRVESAVEHVVVDLKKMTRDREEVVIEKRDSHGVSPEQPTTVLDIVDAWLPPALRPAVALLAPSLLREFPTPMDFVDFFIRIVSFSQGVVAELLCVAVVHFVAGVVKPVIVALLRFTFIVGFCWFVSFLLTNELGSAHVTLARRAKRARRKNPRPEIATVDQSSSYNALLAYANRQGRPARLRKFVLSRVSHLQSVANREPLPTGLALAVGDLIEFYSGNSFSRVTNTRKSSPANRSADNSSPNSADSVRRLYNELPSAEVVEESLTAEAAATQWAAPSNDEFDPRTQMLMVYDKERVFTDDEAMARYTAYADNYIDYLREDILKTTDEYKVIIRARENAMLGSAAANSALRSKCEGFAVLQCVGGGKYRALEKLPEDVAAAFCPRAICCVSKEPGSLQLVSEKVDNFTVLVPGAEFQEIYVSDHLNKYLTLLEYTRIKMRTMPRMRPMKFIRNTGVAGCGKSTLIVEKAANDKGMLAASKVGAEELVKKIAKNRPDDGLQITPRTLGSIMINGWRDSKVRALDIDEGVMPHPGQLVIAALYSGADEVFIYGDVNQFNFINRVYGFSMPVESDLNFVSLSNSQVEVIQSMSRIGALALAFPWIQGTHRPYTYRNGLDVPVAFRDVQGEDYVSLNRKFTRTIRPLMSVNGVEGIGSLSDVPKDCRRSTMYLTWSQKDKFLMVNGGWADAKKVKQTGNAIMNKPQVCTIGESQGTDTDQIILVRLTKNLSPALVNCLRQTYVAMTRHKVSFEYYKLRDSTDDEVCRRIKKVWGITDIEAEHDKVSSVGLAGAKPAKASRVSSLKTFASRGRQFLRKVLGRFSNGSGAEYAEYSSEPAVKMPRVRASAFQLNSVKMPLQEFYDHVLPGNSTVNSLYNNSRVNYWDTKMMVDGHVKVRGDKWLNERPRARNSFEPFLRTSAAPLRDKGLKRTLHALNKRNLATFALGAGIDLSRKQDKIITRFFQTYWGPDFAEKLAWCAENPIYVDPYTLQKWWDAQTFKTKEALLIRGFDVTRENWKLSEFEVILKQLPKPADDRGPQSKDSQPQTVMFTPKEINAIFGPLFVESFSRLIKFCVPKVMINKGKSFDKIRSEFASLRCPNVLDFVENDFSDYDKSQDARVYSIEARIVALLGVDVELAGDWYAAHIVTHNYCRSVALTLTVCYQRKSGDVTTSFGNTLTNMVAIVVGYRFLEDAGENLRFMIFLGDDSLIGIDRGSYRSEDVFEGPAVVTDLFGFSCKVNIYSVGYFCGMYVGQTADGIKLVSDVLRRVDKLGRWDVSDATAFKELWMSLRDVCFGFDDDEAVEILARGMKLRYPHIEACYPINAAAAMVTVCRSFKVFRQLYTENKTQTNY